MEVKILDYHTSAKLDFAHWQKATGNNDPSIDVVINQNAADLESSKGQLEYYLKGGWTMTGISPYVFEDFNFNGQKRTMVTIYKIFLIK